MNFIRGHINSLDARDELTLKALYGRAAPDLKSVEKSPSFIEVFMNRCFSMCCTAHEYHEAQLRDRMASHSPDSPEHQQAHSATLKSSFILRRLVLFGCTYEFTPTALSEALHLLRGLTLRLPSLDAPLHELTSLLERPSYYVTESLAVAHHLLFSLASHATHSDTLCVRSATSLSRVTNLTRCVFTTLSDGLSARVSSFLFSVSVTPLRASITLAA